MWESSTYDQPYNRTQGLPTTVSTFVCFQGVVGKVSHQCFVVELWMHVACRMRGLLFQKEYTEYGENSMI